MNYNDFMEEAEKYDNFPPDFTETDFINSVDNFRAHFSSDPKNEAQLIEWVIENE